MGPDSPANEFTGINDHILADISAAKATVYIEFYIYYNGGRIREIHDELINARERGLEVKMLLDSVGSRTFLRSKEATSLRDAGVEIVEALYANPLRFFLRRLDLRLHRKIILIDGCIGYSGSMNMADPRVFGLNESVGHWIDLMVRVEGPAVAALSGIFSNDWQIETGVSLTNMVYPLACTDPDCMPIQVVPSGPAIAPDNLLHLLLTSIYTARFSIELTTPYFVPDDALVLALKAAALRGVRVSIYLPMRNNSRLVNYASRAFFSELMKAGVRICPFKNGLLHTKCLLVDRQIALVGSVNLDMRSLWLNFEVTLVLSDDGFCQELGRLIDRYNSESDTLDYDRWQRRSRFKQFVENMTRLISPLL